MSILQSGHVACVSLKARLLKRSICQNLNAFLFKINRNRFAGLLPQLIPWAMKAESISVKAVFNIS